MLTQSNSGTEKMQYVRIMILYIQLVYLNCKYGIDLNFLLIDGSTENKKSRLPGFSIRVSNDTTVPTSLSSCYTSLPSDDIPTVIEKACERTTRYVWIYQNHTAAGDVCPILEICEVQVFGKFLYMNESKIFTFICFFQRTK